jgi:hypothetical protein
MGVCVYDLPTAGNPKDVRRKVFLFEDLGADWGGVIALEYRATNSRYAVQTVIKTI